MSKATCKHGIPGGCDKCWAYVCDSWFGSGSQSAAQADKGGQHLFPPSEATKSASQTIGEPTCNADESDNPTEAAEPTPHEVEKDSLSSVKASDARPSVVEPCQWEAAYRKVYAFVVGEANFCRASRDINPDCKSHEDAYNRVGFMMENRRPTPADQSPPHEVEKSEK